MRSFIPLILSIIVFQSIQCTNKAEGENDRIITGAENTEAYISLIKNKNIAVVANQSSLIGSAHLIDSLLLRGIKVVKVFAPEHGFRGSVEAGEEVDHSIDRNTGIKIISLYGSGRKPKSEDLQDIDIILFDLQDVGTRFYTYISTLHYVMEACAENNIKLIILDRPNPNGDCIDGPVLEKEFRSFVGMHKIPVLHGMTMGEYGQMINGEGWLSDNIKCDLKVIPCSNYTYDMVYKPPVSPSPNLPDYQAIRLYPSLCFFEGTDISIGRGTDFPFKVYGCPDFDTSLFSFIPESRPGFSLNPKHKGQRCYGFDLSAYPVLPGEISVLNLEWLLSAYASFPDKSKFFTDYFNTLAGTDKLRKQIEEGLSAEEIKESWKEGLDNFKKTRDKYLIYR